MHRHPVLRVMKMPSVINLCVFILLFVQLCSCCTQQERNALLKLHTALRRDFLHVTSGDCCEHYFVECDRTTHRVIRLDLRFQMGHFLNASMFLPFQQLQYLDLSMNFNSRLQNAQDLARLKKLRVLLLPGINFDTRALESLFTITSLTVLNLRQTGINASFSDLGRGLCKLKNLRELILRRNMISGSIPECFRNLTSLKSLDLSYTNMDGNLDLRTLSTSIEFLSFIDSNKYQQFNTNLFSSPVNRKFRFRYLDLSNCKVNASASDLVSFLHNQPNLISLYLPDNHLHGKFSTSFSQNNSQLRFLSLTNNSFTGIHFPFGSLNLLTWFDISYNYIQGELQSNIGQVLPKLNYFNIANNDLQGGIPVSLGDIKDLVMLDLSNNNLSGKLPQIFGLSFQKIEHIRLSNNRLEGQIPSTIFNLTRLTILILSNNQFTGHIPNNRFRSSELVLLNISQNYISGGIPGWLGTNLTNSLLSLDMHDNFIEGSLRPELCNLTELYYLRLSQNQLSGLVPSCLPTLPQLIHLRLQRNNLTHLQPNVESLGTSKLGTFDLSHNNISGEIPTWFGILENVWVLLLKANRFSGSIPRELCHLSKMGILDLSHNDLSGSVPLCFTNITFGRVDFAQEFRVTWLVGDPPLNTSINFPDLIIQPQWDLFSRSQEALNYHYEEDIEFLMKSRFNIYKGDIISDMFGMDLSCNNFKGNIPLDIGNRTEIRALNLSHNQFTGSIPSSLSKMKQIESIDFSYNKLSGEIPSSLTRLTMLVVFNMAYNNLSGRVPDIAQFSTFNETSYEGNPFLCGPTLPRKQCNIDANGSTKADTHDGQNDMHMIDLNSFLESFAITYVACLLGFVIVLYVNSYWQRRWFHFIDTCTSFLFSFCRSGP